jgi:tRNA A-37 threonylcarbamoyl transferase component Bud32
VPDLVVSIEEDGFVHFPGLAAVLLQSAVGEHYSSLEPEQIVDSVVQLHKNDVCHRDAQVENVVCVDGKPNVDRLSLSFFFPNKTQKDADVELLKRSIQNACNDDESWKE